MQFEKKNVNTSVLYVHVAMKLTLSMNEPYHEKTNNLHMRKQRRRSASR